MMKCHRCAKVIKVGEMHHIDCVAAQTIDGRLFIILCESCRSITVHDHFDGIANCVECKGLCQLPAAEKAYSILVRWTMEHFVDLDQALPYGIRQAMQRAGVNVEQLWERAEQVAKKIRKDGADRRE